MKQKLILDLLCHAFRTEVSELEPMSQIWPTICFVNKVLLNNSPLIYVLSISFFSLYNSRAE